MRELFVGDVDIFRGSDAVDNQFRFNIIGSSLLLTAPQRYPVDVYRSRVDALRSQRANHTLKAHVHLMLDKRLRYGEIVKLDDGGQNLFSQEVLVPPVAVGFEALTEFGLQLVKRAGIADIFGEVVVLDRAALDGREGCGAFGHFLQSFVDVFVSDVHHGHFEIEIFIIAKLEFGENFEDGAEFERLAFGKIELVDLGLRNGGQFLLGDRLFNALRNERLHDFALDIVGEAAADQ